MKGLIRANEHNNTLIHAPISPLASFLCAQLRWFRFFPFPLLPTSSEVAYVHIPAPAAPPVIGLWLSIEGNGASENSDSIFWLIISAKLLNRLDLRCWEADNSLEKRDDS